MTRRGIAAIVLAGGLSTRMKKLKPLLPLGRTTVLHHAVDIFHRVDICVYLVLGSRREEIRAAVKDTSANIVYNPDYRRGMFTSVLAGVRALPPDCRAFFLLPADIPLVSTDTVNTLIAAAQRNPEKIIYPVYKGKRGHPPLIPAACIPAILSYSGEGGLKKLLESFNDKAVEIPVADRFILFDVDTPEDYEELLKNYTEDNAVK